MPDSSIEKIMIEKIMPERLHSVGFALLSFQTPLNNSRALIFTVSGFSLQKTGYVIFCNQITYLSERYGKLRTVLQLTPARRLDSAPTIKQQSRL